MLSRRRAFEGESAPEVLTAILKEDPPELSSSERNVPRGLARVVQRCLEKRPEDRFHSAHDLALALEASSTPKPIADEKPARPRKALALAAGAFVAGALLASLAGLLRGGPSLPRFQQLTFRRGAVLAARFAPDGQTVLYSAAWDGQPSRIYSTRIGSRDSQPLDLPEGTLLAVSAKGELAVKLGRAYSGGEPGTLARASLAGGAPRELLTDVLEAGYTPDGEELVVLRKTSGGLRLEWPMGHVLYEPEGAIRSIRCLRDGQHVAMAEVDARSPFQITLIDRQGRTQALSTGWSDFWSVAGSARAPDEVWFAAAGRGLSEYALRSVTLSGRERIVATIPGDLYLSDVDAAGRVLLVRGALRYQMFTEAPDENQERDLAWLDFSSPADLSPDGSTLLFNELGGGPLEVGSVCLRQTDGSPVVRLGDGWGLSLSADGRSVLALPGPLDNSSLVVVPTGPGASRVLRDPDIRLYFNARWLPDGRHFALIGGPDWRHARLYMWGLEGGRPRALSPEGVQIEGHPASLDVSRDGRSAAVIGVDGTIQVYPLDGGAARPVAGSRPGDAIVRFAADGRSLYVRAPDPRLARIDRIDLASGARTTWRELLPPDPAALLHIENVVMTPDAQAHAYMAKSFLGSLYLAEGLR